MRYIWREIIIRTVTDSNVDKVEDIKELISSLKDKQIQCSIQLNNSPRFEFTRILEVSEKTFKFVIVKNGTLHKVANYTDVSLIEVTAADDDLIRTKPDISRWILLTPTD